MRQGAKKTKQNKTRRHDTQALRSEWMSFEIFMIYCFIGVFLKNIYVCVLFWLCVLYYLFISICK
jgi:hypothetical protein